MENYLKKIREDKKISVIQLSKMTGIPRDTIYKIENGISSIKKENMELLTKALNVTIFEIYGGQSSLICLKYYKNFYEISSFDGTTNDYELVGVSERLLEMLNIKNYLNVIILKSYEKNMEPTISNNDFLLVDLDNKNILNDKLYIIDENGKLKIKRIKRSNPFNSVVIFQSDNQIDGEYPPYEVTLIKAKEMILGQVVFYGRSIL